MSTILQGITKSCALNVATVSGDENISINGNLPVYRNAYKKVTGIEV